MDFCRCRQRSIEPFEFWPGVRRLHGIMPSTLQFATDGHHAGASLKRVGGLNEPVQGLSHGPGSNPLSQEEYWVLHRLIYAQPNLLHYSHNLNFVKDEEGDKNITACNCEKCHPLIIITVILRWLAVGKALIEAF
ncbi:hypothetical protein UPYG_G00241040 [Umbra pygmaea]|uniref:Uncharacterized protein n=1 Tax=Umbra pygmaea TaxID=75934 RepID=A0ABD0WKC8_UMBPY